MRELENFISKIKTYGVRKLSKVSGVSQHTLYGWTNKGKKPSARIVKKVAQHIGFDEVYFYE